MEEERIKASVQASETAEAPEGTDHWANVYSMYGNRHVLTLLNERLYIPNFE